MLKDKDSQNIVIFTIAVIILSGLLLLLHFAFPDVGDYDVSFPQFAPAIAVLFLLMIRQRTITSRLASKFKMNKRSFFYGMASPLMLGIVILLCGFILSALSRPYSQWGTPSVTLSLLFLLIGSIAEEIGWRGFLLPALHNKVPLIVSAVIVGIFWGVWHLNFADGVGGFFVYILFTTILSVVMSWVQAKNNHNIFPAITTHFFLNLFMRLFLFDRINWLAFLILTGFLSLIALILFIADKKTFLSKDINGRGSRI